MTLTIETRLSHKYFERKTKYELAGIIMANLDKIDIFKTEYESEIAKLRREVEDLRRQLAEADAACESLHEEINQGWHE